MPTLYDRQGQPVQVPHEQVLELLQSGQFGLPDTVNLVDGKGGAQELTGPDIGKALMSGWRLEDPEEAQSRMARQAVDNVPGTMAAATIGALRGATLGASDFVMSKTGFIPEEQLAALDEANPVASIGGEIAGVVSGALLTKKVPTPAGMAARLGTGTATTVENAALRAMTHKAKAGAMKKALAKGMGYTAGGAVEGGVYGVGGAVTEEALGRSDTVGEALAAHVGPSMLFGGAAGGVFGSAAGILAPTLNKTAKRVSARMGEAAREAIPQMERAAADEALKAAGWKAAQIDSVFNKRGKGMKWAKAVREAYLEQPVHPDGFPVIHKGLDKFTKDAIKARVVEAKAHTWTRMEEAIERLEALADSTGKPLTVDNKAIAAKVRELAAEIRGAQPKHKKLANQLNRMIAKEIGDGPEWTLAEARNWRAQYRESWSMGQDNFTNRVWQDVESLIRHAEKDAMKKAGGDIIPAWQAAERNELVMAYEEAARHYRGLAGGIKDGLVERGTGLTGKILSSMAHGATAGLFFGNIPGKMAVHGVIGGIRGGAAKAAGPARRAMLANKAAKLHAIDEMVTKVQGRIDKAMTTLEKGFRGAHKGGVPASLQLLQRVTGERDREKAYIKLKHDVAQVVGNPEYAAQRMAAATAGLDEAAPKVSAAMAHTTAMAVKQLAETFPTKKVHPEVQPLLQAVQTPPKTEIAKFASTAQGLLDPISVFEDFANGIVNRQAAATMRAAYPNLVDLIAGQLNEMVAKQPKALNYIDKVRLSIFLGQPMDQTTEAGYIARAQAAFAQLEEPPQQQAPAPKKKKDKGLDASSLMTETQKMETPV